MSSENDYKIFDKMVDNLNYQKGYNIILILIICIINVFAFDASIGGVIFALIVIFYVIFYKKLNLSTISYGGGSGFFHTLNTTSFTFTGNAEPITPQSPLATPDAVVRSPFWRAQHPSV